MVDVARDPRLASRPRSGRLVIPYMVDESKDPIDFKALDPTHVENCARKHRCGVCGKHIAKRHAFIGPIQRAHTALMCFGDPWMHVGCAEYVAEACPFVSGRSPEYRGQNLKEALRLVEPHQLEQWMVIARDGKAHRQIVPTLKGPYIAWHFAPAGVLDQRLIRSAEAEPA